MKMVISSQLSVVSIKKPSALLRFCASALFLLLTFSFQLSTCYAKVYIDITSPSIKKLPIAVQEFDGPEGENIAKIIIADLDFTGLFICLDKSTFIERPTQPFNPQNWRVIGAEAVVKGTITSVQTFAFMVSFYDSVEGKEIFKKEYKSGKDSVRQLAHAIANDIYRQVTGENGIFRTKVAFVAEDEGKKGLYMMDWDGSAIRRLGIKGDFVLKPHWSKDGSKLVYSSERGRQWGIYMLDFTKMTEKKIFSSGGVNMVGSFSPDGEEVMLSSSRDETYGLYNLRLSDLKLTRITSARGIEISPSVSPDGKQVAFVSDRGGTPQIYIMDRNGYGVRRLTFEGSNNTSPSWSPAGDKIVFVGIYSGRRQIFIINPDGSGPTQLTDKGNNEDPSFSPDGRYIIFSSDRDKGNGIFIMKATGESQKRITPQWLRAFGPAWALN